MAKISQAVHYPSMRSHRFHLLDGLRGVAAILVVLYHTSSPYRTRLPMPQAWLAVDFFFLLSGFVIAFSYELRLSTGTRLRDFTCARLIRLYPLYLAGTVLGLISVAIVDSLSTHVVLSVPDIALSLPSALLLIPNFLNHWPAPYCFPFDPPAWSLFLEIVANLTFAFLIRRRLGNTALIFLFAMTSFLILLVAAHLGSSTLDGGAFLSSVYFGVPRAGFSFFTGVLVFRLYKSQSAPAHAVLRRWVFPIVSCVGLTVMLLASSRVTSSFAYQLFVVAILFPALLFFGARSQLPALGNRLCAFLGDISYPLYVLHAPFILPLNGSKPLAFFAFHTAAKPWLLPLVFTFLIALAWFAARYPDRAIRLWLTRHYNAATPKDSSHGH